MGKGSYEECRLRKMEENKKRMEELKLVHLCNSLQSLRPKSKSSSIKKSKAGTEWVVVRRSARVAGNSTPVYEVEVKRRWWWRRRVVTDEEKTYALEQAQKLDSKLVAGAPDQPTFVKSMVHSNVRGGYFWFSAKFCRRHLPGKDEMITLVDEQGSEFPTLYLARNTRFTAGWADFVRNHDLYDGDAIILQKINYSHLKVYIVKATESGEDLE